MFVCKILLFFFRNINPIIPPRAHFAKAGSSSSKVLAPASQRLLNSLVVNGIGGGINPIFNFPFIIYNYLVAIILKFKLLTTSSLSTVGV